MTEIQSKLYIHGRKRTKTDYIPLTYSNPVAVVPFGQDVLDQLDSLCYKIKYGRSKLNIALFEKLEFR